MFEEDLTENYPLPIKDPTPKIDEEEISGIIEYKQYFNNVNLFLIKVGKYSYNHIIILCHELYENDTDPEFYYSGIFSLKELSNKCSLFLLYKNRDKLYKLFLSIFTNKQVNIIKEQGKTYIKLLVRIILPAGDAKTIMLQLFRKNRQSNIPLYDKYISFSKKNKPVEDKKEKILNSFGDDSSQFNYDLDINYDHQDVSIPESKKRYVSKYGAQKFFKDLKNKNKTKENSSSESSNESSSSEVDSSEKENDKKNNIKKKGKKETLTDEELLQKFNKKYGVSLQIDSKEIDLFEKNLLSEGVNSLAKIKFTNVQNMWLDNNYIFHIKGLINSSFDNLKILSIHDNKISNIDAFQRFRFTPSLSELYLYNNKISTLDGLAGCDFSELTVLQIFNNNLTNIDGLGSCIFKKLKKLSLYNNKILNIEKLGNCNFSTLNVLSLYNNKIASIEPLVNCDLSQLNELVINKNKISNIDCFEQMNFSHLTLLVLQNNVITNIDVLLKCRFDELRTLYLYRNKISKNLPKNKRIMSEITKKNKNLKIVKW